MEHGKVFWRLGAFIGIENKATASQNTSLISFRNSALVSMKMAVTPEIIVITSISADDYHRSQANDCLHYTRTANGTGWRLKDQSVQPDWIREPMIISKDGEGVQEKSPGDAPLPESSLGAQTLPIPTPAALPRSQHNLAHWKRLCCLMTLLREHHNRSLIMK